MIPRMLVGRSAETEAIQALLEGARDGQGGALVLRGEPGVGKSALLEEAAASAEGFTVLRAVGIESESELAFAGLHQVLWPVLDRVERLPGPQATALRAAFALSEETVAERLHVSLGALGLLCEAADAGPTLCLVDDAHWLDQASADALLFSARRLEAEPVVLLLAVRDDPERPFAAPGIRELRPAPLGPDDARALVGSRVGQHVAFEVLDWLLATADGNPLALVELPATLTREQLAGREPLDGTVPRPTSVEQSYLARAERLPADVRELLLLAACEEQGDRATLAAAAAELGLDPATLSAAEDEQLVAVGRDRVEFRHPLVRSAVYRGAGFAQRERAHRALAAALSAPAEADRRAWHRAAATVGTDDGAAAELEATAERARQRGGPAAAASALERAAQLSAGAEMRGRRLVLAGRGAWDAGQRERATSLLDRASPLITSPPLRAELDHVRGLIEFRGGSLLESLEILVEGSERVASLDPSKALAMLLDAGSVAAKSGSVARLAEIARRLEALPRGEGEEDAVRVDLVIGVGGLVEGRTAREVPLIRNALARAGEHDEPHLLSWAAMGAAALGEEAAEAAFLRRAVGVARTSGSLETLAFVLEVVVNASMLSGRYDIETEAAEGLALAREAGLRNTATAHLAALAWVSGLRGAADDCRAYAAEATAAARAAGLADANTAAEWGLAVLDLGAGRPAEAASRLLEIRAAPPGVGHSLLNMTAVPDLVEACVRAGRPEDARRPLAALEAFARPGAPEWVLALAARCRALLAEGAEAERWYAEALRLHAEGNRPFDRARTELVYGEYLRRERRRTDAREQLRAALTGFEHLRAEPWAERARGELRATGETVRRRDPSTIDELTPQELQIARFVAEGLSNKEVAAQLFISPRTVEYHLRKVFAKLGIASRAELIRDGAPALA
jgi:DNA-binding NarL/FixJ family response regulator